MLWKFKYKPLKEGEIRIIELFPGSRRQPIWCRLLHVLASDFGDYEAVSYTWGPEPAERRIWIEGQYPLIEEVLEQGAPPGTPRRLWIDAICINQEDFSERNQQIRLMCSIYSRCKRLLVWFGSEDEQSGSAFRAWAKVILDSPFLHIILASVDGLLGRPWFTRTWVLQE
ncbi:HET-domain-containing protein, partial [Hyaloscypha bicolor E]